MPAFTVVVDVTAILTGIALAVAGFVVVVLVAVLVLRLLGVVLGDDRDAAEAGPEGGEPAEADAPDQDGGQEGSPAGEEPPAS